jgi:hypothetical protein
MYLNFHQCQTKRSVCDIGADGAHRRGTRARVTAELSFADNVILQAILCGYVSSRTVLAPGTNGVVLCIS